MQNRRSVLLLAVATAAAALVAGCGEKSPSPGVGTALSGNWSFTPAAATVQSVAPALNLGFTQGAYETVSAVARLSGSSCISPTTNILLTGSVAADNQMELVSSTFSGTTLTLKGEVAANGKGIAGASWSFAGGSCGALGTAEVRATDYSNIGGTFTGTFVDTSGNQIPVSAMLEQTTEPDQNGQFSISGTATFPSNTCFVQQPTVTQSVVTGSSLTMTYTDPGSSAVLTASGTFNAAATQLTISSWSIAGGSCGGDSGTGSLTEQQ